MSVVLLAHLSDLHIGGKKFGNSYWRTNLPGVRNLKSDNGHDDVLTAGMNAVWKHLGAMISRTKAISDPGVANAPVRAVVTGDLSRRGRLDELRWSREFLESNWAPPPGIPAPGL